jgi:ATP-dependent helicase/nuclease subunit B
LQAELKFIIKTINDQNKLSSLDNALYEEKIYVNIPNKIDVTFSGIIDKIMYKEEDNALISLVDYKTGNTEINIDNAIHGLNMQLPIYLYLVKNSHKFNNPKFIGFYLQEILHNEIYKDNKKDYETIKSDALKLKGYTIDQGDLISKFDSSYLDSRVIKSMKVGNNGFYQYSKVLNANQIDKLIDLVSSKINEASTNIIDGKFDINPKSLNGKNVACEFCELRDMCYMKDSNITFLKEQKYSDFLGGDKNE